MIKCQNQKPNAPFVENVDTLKRIVAHLYYAHNAKNATNGQFHNVLNAIVVDIKQKHVVNVIRVVYSVIQQKDVVHQNAITARQLVM